MHVDDNDRRFDFLLINTRWDKENRDRPEPKEPPKNRVGLALFTLCAFWCGFATGLAYLIKAVWP